MPFPLPWLPGHPGFHTLLAIQQALAEHEREEAARERARSIQRARMGLFPYRKPERGKVGYWWRRQWRFRVLKPRAYELRKASCFAQTYWTMTRTIERARAEGRL